MKKVVLVDCAAPVPVGHKVQVRNLKEEERGFLSRRVGSKHQVDQPWVRDLDTGVEYGVYWQYADLNAVPGEPGVDFGGVVRGDLEEVAVVTGQVMACRVMTITGERWRIQTRLVLEVE